MTDLATFLAFPHDHSPTDRSRMMAKAFRAVADVLDRDAADHRADLANALVDDMGYTLEFMEANGEFGVGGLKL